MGDQHPGIAGIGAVSSVGRDAAECFDALWAGASGIAPLRRFPDADLRQGRAYEIEETQSGETPGRACRLAEAAIAEALDDAGISDLAGIPIYVGTGLGEARSAELSWIEGERRGDAAGISLKDRLARALGSDDVHVFQNACSASLYALAMAFDAIVHDAVPVVVVAGVDVVSLSMFGLLDRVQLSPTAALRPFAAEDKGVIMGEGAAAVVLTRETVEGARLRGVHLGCDAHHLTAPDPVGVRSCVVGAHRSCGVEPRDVDLVYAHGTGTKLNDAVEAQVLREVFADDGGGPAITGVKGATGHTSGGSGLFSLVMAVLSLRSGRVPGIGHDADLMEDATHLDVVRDGREIEDLRIAQVNAFGFGGLNAVAVLER